MYKISHEVINVIEKTMRTWRVELTAGGRSLAEIKRYFPRRCTITVTFHNSHDLTYSKKCTVGYKIYRLQEKFNHLIYLDVIKLFAKNEKELETLIHAVRIYNQDIGMEVSIENCAMLVMKSGKRHMSDGMELPNQDKIKTHGGNDIYKYFGILEVDTIKQVEMKDKIQKEYLRRTRKLLETKISGRNLIKGIHTWAVFLIRYSGPFFKWTRDKLKQMDQRPRKLNTMHKVLYPRDDVYRLYVSGKEGGGAIDSIEDSVNVSIQRLEDYIEKHERVLITAIRKDNNTIDGRMTITRKQKWDKTTL